MPIYKGGAAQALWQPQTTPNTLPSPVDTTKLKFSELEISDGEEYIDDNTIDNSSPLKPKRDDSDQGYTANLKAILCLNEIGLWLRALWGPPVTTGTGPFTHTFTLDLSDRPINFMELGYTDASIFRLFVNCVVNKLSYAVTEKEQNIDIELMPGQRRTSEPTQAFDNAPLIYAKNRAASKAGEVYDVSGASTLGQVSAATVEITNNIEPQHIADNEVGYTAWLLGDPDIGGTITWLFSDTSGIFNYEEDHTSVQLSLVSRNPATSDTLELRLDSVEFDKAKYQVQTRNGIIMESNWRAHASAIPPRFILTNGVSSYA